MTKQEIKELAGKAYEMSTEMMALTIRPWMLKKKDIQRIDIAKELLEKMTWQQDKMVGNSPEEWNFKFQRNMLETFIKKAEGCISEFCEEMKEAGWEYMFTN